MYEYHIDYYGQMIKAYTVENVVSEINKKVGLPLATHNIVYNYLRRPPKKRHSLLGIKISRVRV